MSKEIYISSTPHETRLAIVEDEGLTEIYYERENEYTLAGSIYNGKVTRVLPGMQSSFVDIGLERDAFLYITDFMEEAGDSADFDTSDGHRSHNGEGRREPRNGNREALPEGATAASPEDSAGHTSERSERNGRDRGGRGRRDRGGRSGNRDRQPHSDTQPLDNPEAIRADFNQTPDSAADFTSDDAPVERTDGADLGEGAPGADGSRRWRGRRGRRRGRGPGQRDESPQPTEAASNSDSVASEASPETSYDDSFDIDSAAASRSDSNNTAPIASAYPAADAPQENAGRRDRNDRGDRGSRGDRGDRGGRGGRDQRAPRVPRGFAPKTSLYGVDDAPAHEEASSDGPAAEPFLLPGESLSKYRKPTEESASASSLSAPKAADPTVILPSAPEFAIPDGWDGGAILPGETLSRRHSSESHSSESRHETRREPRHDSRHSHSEPRHAAPSHHEEPRPTAPVE
ncbi:MAG: hypothetical protein ABI072_01295, partial [Edaphobacter sp.]